MTTDPPTPQTPTPPPTEPVREPLVEPERAKIVGGVGRGLVFSLVLGLAAGGVGLGVASGKLSLPLPAPAKDQAAPAPEGVNLAVTSEPDGASVVIGGTYLGLTPLTASDFPPGTYVVQIEKRGYRPDASSVTFSTGNSAHHRVLELLPTGTLKVESNPPGASVDLDGRRIGTAPLSIGVGVGEHQILCSRTNYLPARASATVKPGETCQATLVLKNRMEAYYEAAVAADPNNIQTRIDMAHHYFVLRKLQEAAAAYAEAMGKIVELRGEDIGSVMKEIEKDSKTDGAFGPIAEAKILEMAEKSPRKSAIWLSLARTYEREGQFDKASQMYDRAIEAGGGDQNLLLELARLCWRRRAYPKLLDTLDRMGAAKELGYAVAVDAANIGINAGRQEAQYKERLVGKAIEILLGAVKNEKTPPDRRAEMAYTLSDAYKELGNKDGRIQALRQAVTLGPAHPARHTWNYSLATLLADAGQDQEALDRFRDVAQNGNTSQLKSQAAEAAAKLARKLEDEAAKKRAEEEARKKEEERKKQEASPAAPVAPPVPSEPASPQAPSLPPKGI